MTERTLGGTRVLLAITFRLFTIRVAHKFSILLFALMPSSGDPSGERRTKGRRGRVYMCVALNKRRRRTRNSCPKSRNLNSECPTRARPSGLRSRRNEFTVTWPAGNCNLPPGALLPRPSLFANSPFTGVTPREEGQTRRWLTCRRLPKSTITFRREWRKTANFWRGYSRDRLSTCRKCRA